jgi:hypothetical protein
LHLRSQGITLVRIFARREHPDWWARACELRPQSKDVLRKALLHVNGDAGVINAAFAFEQIKPVRSDGQCGRPYGVSVTEVRAPATVLRSAADRVVKTSAQNCVSAESKSIAPVVL